MTIRSDEDRAAALRQAIQVKRAAARSSSARLPPRPGDEPAFLGELQRSLWLRHELQPESAAYNLTSAFRVCGELDVAALEAGWNRVVSRHRVLRSTFRARRRRVHQIIHPHVPLEVERIQAGPNRARVRAVAEARRPFDLEVGPLVRLLLIEGQDGQERLLVLVLHHILADERSLAVLWKELAESFGSSGLDPAEPAQYDDYAHWMAGQVGERRAVDRAYWLERLRPPPEVLALPFEKPAQGPVTDRGQLLSDSLGSGASDAIRRVAATAGTTPFAVAAFVFRLLLHRTTMGRRVAFATPATMRSHPATAEMIGYLLNPVVLEMEVDESSSVVSAIREFGEGLRERLAHGSVPFDQLVEELSPERQGDRHPIFQTMFVYQETPSPPVLGAARLEPVVLDLAESKFDLTLFVSEGPGGLEIAVEYRCDRFDRESMTRLLGHYATLLGALEGWLDRAVSELPTLSPAEAAVLRSFSEGEPLDLADSPLVPERVFDQARRSPQDVALLSDGDSWSYADLDLARRSVAAALVRRGVVPGDRVGLFIDRSPLMIAAVMGIHWAGAAYVPLDPAYPSERNAAVLEDAEVTAVLTRSRLLSSAPRGSFETFAVDALAESPGEKLPTLHADLPAYLLYTSGSTGRPKGVVVSHGNLRASNGARAVAYGTPPKRFLLLSSVAFDSSVAGIFWTLSSGGTLVLPSDEDLGDPRRLARLAEESGVTSLLCVPSLYAHILETGQDRLRGLESVIVAGENCPARLVEEHFRVLPGVRLFNEYGPTEATVWATLYEMKPGDSEGPVSIGSPIPGVRVEVLDALGRRLPVGIPGQGWISGPTLAQGYWRRPELSKERFGRHRVDGGQLRRMYPTGDRMTWTSGGRLIFGGRLDEQIKIRGFRVEPGEVESALLDLPGVEEAAVVARGGGRLVAFVKAIESIEERRDQLARRLPEYMMPSRFVDLESLPRLPNGKVDRSRLREMELEPTQSEVLRVEILDDRRQALVSLWKGLLGRSAVGLDDNFFLLGGHSLLVVEMTTAIERDFAVSIAPAEVFQNPTIRQLAERIEQVGGSETASYSHLFPIQPGGHETPFIFCVPHFFSEMAASRFRGERPVYGLRGVSLRPEGNRGRWPTMRELGEELVEEVCRRFPDEPVILAGYSFGATMAVEAARLMEVHGVGVERLYLIAPMPIDIYRLGPLRFQLDALRRPLDELSTSEALRLFARDNRPLSRRPYQRLWRQVAIQPWRRLLCLAGRVRSLAGLPLTEDILYADVRLERFRLHAGYRPGVVRTPTVIFNAREPDTDAAATWRPYFGGPFTVHDIPDPHLGGGAVRAAREAILGDLADLGNQRTTA